MRLCIIAFDGLEYTLVNEWKKSLPYLTQKKYGFFESTEEIATPFLWASMITGHPNPKEALKEYAWSYPANRFIRFIWKHFKFLRRKGLGKLLGIKRKLVDKTWLTKKSIFDEYNSIVVNFPAYKWTLPDLIFEWRVVEIVGDPVKSEFYYREILKNDYNTLRKSLELLNKDEEWDIFAAWFYFTDMVNHLFGKNRMKVFSAYLRANRFAKKIIEAIHRDDVITVVISDHGGLEGVHTKKAFISINKEDIEFPKNITEVYSFFKRILTS